MAIRKKLQSISKSEKQNLKRQIHHRSRHGKDIEIIRPRIYNSYDVYAKDVIDKVDSMQEQMGHINMYTYNVNRRREKIDT